MTKKLYEELHVIAADIAHISNEHIEEWMPWESRMLNDAYYALIDIFDIKKANEYNEMMEGLGGFDAQE